jgi:hypothetical protein
MTRYPIPHPIDLTLTQPVFASELVQYARDSRKALAANIQSKNRRACADMRHTTVRYARFMPSIFGGLAMAALPVHAFV